MINIFFTMQYKREDQKSENATNSHDNEINHKLINEESYKNKRYSHYRMKWNLIYADSKINSFIFGMKDTYHKLF